MNLRKRTFFTSRLTPLAWTGLALAATQAGAQDAPKPDFSEFEAVEKAGWFVRLGGKALFNVKASVLRSQPLPDQGYFDNGFVLPDAGGPGSGLTWNWGYANDSQFNDAADTLNFERYLGLPDAGSYSNESEIAPGAELMFGVKFGEFEVGKKTWNWGFEMGGGYNIFELSGIDSASGNSIYRTASFDTGGILLPVPPYAGTYEGPGPVIGLSGASNDTASPASSTVDGTLESSLYNLKLGIWFDMPLTEKLDLSWSAGFSSLYADTQYKFTEDISFANSAIPGINPIDTTVNGRNWQQGGYIQARLNYNFSNHWSAYAAADYQYNGTLYFSGANRDIEMDFTALFGASLGISFNW